VESIGSFNYDAGLLDGSFQAAKGNRLRPNVVLQQEFNPYDRSAFESGLRDVCLRVGMGARRRQHLREGDLELDLTRWP